MSWGMGSHTSRLALWLVGVETGPSWWESCVGVCPQLPLSTSGPSQGPGRSRRAVFTELPSALGFLPGGCRLHWPQAFPGPWALLLRRRRSPTQNLTVWFDFPWTCTHFFDFQKPFLTAGTWPLPIEQGAAQAGALSLTFQAVAALLITLEAASQPQVSARRGCEEPPMDRRQFSLRPELTGAGGKEEGLGSRMHPWARATLHRASERQGPPLPWPECVIL